MQLSTFLAVYVNMTIICIINLCYVILSDFFYYIITYSEVFHYFFFLKKITFQLFAENGREIHEIRTWHYASLCLYKNKVNVQILKLDNTNVGVAKASLPGTSKSSSV